MVIMINGLMIELNLDLCKPWSLSRAGDPNEYRRMLLRGRVPLICNSIHNDNKIQLRDWERRGRTGQRSEIIEMHFGGTVKTEI
jgi:hypothetical protein